MTIDAIVIPSASNKLNDIEPYTPALHQTLDSPLERRVYHIGGLRLA